MSTVRRRLSPEQRRAQLLEIGARLFAEHPYDEVWIEEVADRAGVSRGLLYHYFATKRDFFAEIVRAESDKLVELSDAHPELPLRQRLLTGLDGYLDYVEAHEHGYRAVHRGAASADEGIRAIVQAGFTRQEQRILAVLDPDEQTALLLRVAIRGWLAFVTAACLDWLDHRSITRDQLRDLCAQVLLGAAGVS